MSGRIIGKEEASKEFGSVTESIKINSNEILNIAKSFDGYYFLINIFEGKLVLANILRTKIYPAETELKKDEILIKYSKKLLYELIELGGSIITEVQLRGEVICIENGAYVLEYGAKCPPYC